MTIKNLTIIRSGVLNFKDYWSFRNGFFGLEISEKAVLYTTPLLAQENTESSSPAYEVEYQIPESYKDFWIAIGGGYAYRLGKIEETGDPGIDDLNKQLRHGFNIDADAQYFFKDIWGLGLNANYCGSSTSGSNISLPDMAGKWRICIPLVKLAESNMDVNSPPLATPMFFPSCLHSPAIVSERVSVTKRTLYIA